MKKQSNIRVFANGLLKENPALRLMLGVCPALAVTTAVYNSLGMGIAVMIVLLCANLLASLLQGIIPKGVKLPSYIIIIATLVTLLHMMVRIFFPQLNNTLGIYLPLVTVNCIILGRVDTFASKNRVLPAVLDALGMGIGFSLVLFIMGSIREIFGFGTWLGFQVIPETIPSFAIMTLPAGGFFVLGVLAALVCFTEQMAKRSFIKKERAKRAEPEEELLEEVAEA
ncbi:MAG: electron transport complex subunit RsxE [Oscillospiraceae bacterium]